MKKCKIKSIKFIGKRKTYNLSMKSDQHNYAIYDYRTGKSVFSQNSHAGAYSMTSYITAFLKANYPDEFICSLLSVEAERAHWDKVENFERSFGKKMDITILSRNINNCKVNYTIEKKKDKSSGVDKTEIRPGLLCKGSGLAPAKNIEENQPYENLHDFAKRTSFSVVDTRVIDSLCEAGFFGEKGKRNKEKMVENFSKVRQDIKTAMKKGIESVDIFN